MTARRRVFLATVGLVLGVWLWGASAAWASYTVVPMCTSGGKTSVCGSAWYTGDVSLSWTWSPQDGGNPTAGCVPHSYVVDTSAIASCTIAGSSGQTTANQPLHIEVSNPAVTGAPVRPPDSNGWYNHSVAIAFHGSAFSGIVSCTTATYAGPDSAGARVSGSCTDNAGKTATVTSAPFAYDAPPVSVAVVANSGDHFAVLGWGMTDVAPATRFEIVRRPGLGRKKASVVYRGPGHLFRDNRVRNRARYRYTVIAHDVAGNSASSVTMIRPGPRLLSPANGTQLAAPPLLLWTPVRRASYYNVQLWRGRKELLSIWPTRVSLQLTSTWSFQRHRYRLRPGTYRWYVWPGFGRRAATRYGRMIGWRTFVVMRS